MLLANSHAYMTMRNTTLSHIKAVLKSPALIWKYLQIEREYIDRISEVADEHAFIDPENKKRKMWQEVLNGRGSFFVADCGLARIYWISEQTLDKALNEVNWELWGRIIQSFGKSRGSRWEAVVFAMNHPRIFPEKGQLIGPVHINGGAARPCVPNSILIIRKEEATRVLIHELLHAGCTDTMTRTTNDIEGWTEAWAEWFLCALVSRTQHEFDVLWKKQVAWALAQADKCFKRGHIHNIEDYGARYIVLRIHVWKRLGIIPEHLPKVPKVNSLRFTLAEFDEI
jgi:hypothetical protein